MDSPLKSLISTGTKLWLDSVDPELVAVNRALGVTGATSNPVIVTQLLKTGRFDTEIEALVDQGRSDSQIAWEMTDRLVRAAQDVFLPVWDATSGDDGYVSFELDPLLEDAQSDVPHSERVAAYIELGRRWAAGHRNRMIKVPATPAGIGALEELAAEGVTLNVTLVFTARQYRAARDAAWRGAQRLGTRSGFKCVYSIFVSRVDIYADKHLPQLTAAAQGWLGIVNAKRIWAENREFWADKKLPLAQEIIFASTGTKKPSDVPWKYLEAFAGSDIETNPPETNEAYARSGRAARRQVAELPPREVLDELDRHVDWAHLEATLMAEGIKKFADPQMALLAFIAEKRTALAIPR